MSDVTNDAAAVPGAAAPGAAAAGLPAWVLQVLRCPADTGELDVTDVTLTCRTCGRRYPVRDGIPVLLVEEAELSHAGEPAGTAGTTEPADESRGS